MIYYIRNDVDDLLGFKYNNTVYYYIKSIQDDIIGIIDSNNNIIANYKYDSWGNIISITDNNGNDISNNTNHIANINPFRYRSYYYDTETNLYYLNSRYYNPTWGRFINADGIIGANEDILGYNLYAYCSNNCITSIDDSGYNWLKKATKIVKKIQKKVQNIVKTVTKKNTITKKTTVKQTSSSKSNTNKNKLPTIGKPNTTLQKPNGDLRSYGPDGKAKTDTDYSHPEHHPDLPNPHAHDWSWNGNLPSRGPAYDPNIGQMVSDSVKVIGIGYLVYRGIRLLPSLLPPFWWTAPINVATP